ncbi:MAG: hypothetical protein GXO35_08100 [Gammaproteobacteria bacterium]|nr:hypothetical protein [Gammaproteobacteria bacterium]
MKKIELKNANEHNLKNVSVDFPLNQMISVFGVSGSGKSSLIYGVIANESTRRAKIVRGDASCLDYAIRSDFESLNNLPFCKTLKQRGLQVSVSSTLSTVTGIHELLREEFVLYGEIVGERKNIIEQPSLADIQVFLKLFHKQERFRIFACLCYEESIEDGSLLFELLKENEITEVIVISSRDNIQKTKKISVIKNLSRQFDYTILVPVEDMKDIERFSYLAKRSYWCQSEQNFFYFGEDFPDLKTGKLYQKKSSHLLSFNSILPKSGKCSSCHGKGTIETLDITALIDECKPLYLPFLRLTDNGKGCYKYIGLCFDDMQRAFIKQGIKLEQTFLDLTVEQQTFVVDMVYPKIEKHKKKPSIGQFLLRSECRDCEGTRLNKKARAVELFGLSLPEYLALTVSDLILCLKDKPLKHKKIVRLLKALEQSTLGYLALDRTTDTLSGGELQRLKFSLALTNDDTGLLYILDEPSTGLHAFNNYQMIPLIKALRDKGNTVLISEHNADYIKASDYSVEMGPKAGKGGGRVIRQSNDVLLEDSRFERVKKIVNQKDSISLQGVNFNNIINENFIIPKHCLVVVSGVSGSGKSSLVHDVLVPVVKQHLESNQFSSRLVSSVGGLNSIEGVVELTQSQIGLNSRSIVATYLGIFDHIRGLYAGLADAKIFGLDKRHFSFNNALGACDICAGLGVNNEQVCSGCLGHRFKPEVLHPKFLGKNIDGFLNTDIESILEGIQDDLLLDAFKVLNELGLSHLSLGRTTPSLSGGESQRLKLAKVLIKNKIKLKKGNYLFVLDEPTKGLSGSDIEKLYKLIDDLLLKKHSVVVIEHHLGMIGNADFVIDMGLGSGLNGGVNLYSGSVLGLLNHPKSLTAQALRGGFDMPRRRACFVENSEITVPIKINNVKKTKASCHPFYLNDEHFAIEKKFFNAFSVNVEGVGFFRTEKDLIAFCATLEIEECYFNPYVTDLFKYKIVPKSIKKSSLKQLKKLGFDVKKAESEFSEWDCRVKADDVLTAYRFGRGWVTLKTKSGVVELSTRLVSLESKVIGSAEINLQTFNLYMNSCQYCNYEGQIAIYANDLIIAKQDLSVLDKGFFRSNIALKLKSVITKFSNEGLFDFSKPYSTLLKEEKAIFWFGFEAHRFLKPKGRAHVKSDYLVWKGLYHYIYEALDKIECAESIKSSKKIVECPFCEGKIGAKELGYYYVNGRSWLQKISAGRV